MDEETLLQGQRVRGVLLSIIFAAGAVGLAELALWSTDREPWYLGLAGATLGLSLVLMPLLGLARHRPGRAIALTALAILAIQASYIVLFPQASVAVALAAVVTAALALTYASGETVLRVMAVSAGVAVIGVAAGQWLEPPFEPATIQADIIIVITAAAAVVVTFTLLWQFATRLNGTLDQTRKANASLREAAEDRIRFVNTAAHELRTPLMPMQMQVRLLATSRAAGLTSEQGRSVQMLDRNLQRLSALVEDLLEVARAQAGRAALEREPVDVRSLVSEVRDEYSAAANLRGLHLSSDVQGDVQASLDRRKAYQVLSNLVGNAMKFTPAGGRVEVRAQGLPGFVQIDVQDTGLGMTPEGLQRIFRPFSQVHDVLQVTDAGSGLGLYIAKTFVEAHGGTITASSPGKGKGALFRILLPRSG